MLVNFCRFMLGCSYEKAIWEAKRQVGLLHGVDRAMIITKLQEILYLKI